MSASKLSSGAGLYKDLRECIFSFFYKKALSKHIPSPAPRSKTQNAMEREVDRILISKSCFESCPCMHFVTIYYKGDEEEDRKPVKRRMSAVDIYYYIHTKKYPVDPRGAEARHFDYVRQLL